MRLNFEFNVVGTVSASFNPEEFRGLTLEQVRDAIRTELPGHLDPDEVSEAAEAIINALR
jgi:protein involved in polysaccharide export with SLBB domain